LTHTQYCANPPGTRFGAYGEAAPILQESQGRRGGGWRDRSGRRTGPMPHRPNSPLLAAELVDGCVAEGGELLDGEGRCYAEMGDRGLPELGNLGLVLRAAFA